MKLNTLYKRATNSKVVEHTIEVENNCFRTISGYTDGIKTTSEWTCCSGKNIGKKNETTPNEQAMAEAKAMWTKRVELGNFENINDIDNEVYFSPMLAHKWEDRKDKIQYPVFSQPKLDGIRCIVRSDGMWSRNGKRIVSAPHIFESMKHLFDENPDLIFDGELYADKFANDFNAICSLVKKTKPTEADLKASAESIQYHIYDLPSCDCVFLARYIILSKLQTPKYCKLVPTDVCPDEDTIQLYYYQYIEQGYEGQMIRINSHYENKRSKSLLKRKEFEDDEFEILAVNEGTGKLASRVGNMLFKSKSDYYFTSTVNGTQEYLSELWEKRDELVGKQATIKYFNLTPDGVPRFPKVIGIRDFE